MLSHYSQQNITWLIIARGFAGVGGGGIVSSVWVITSEIVEVRNRAKWSQALSITWSCSAIAGPLLGGVFSSKLVHPISKSADSCDFSRKFYHVELEMGL